MFYITKAKYVTLLNSLCFNIPFRQGEENQYIWGSKLKSFDLALSYFTLSEARALLISELLFQDVSDALNQLLIKRVKSEQEQWVFEVSFPKYHLNKDCEYLNSDFSNVRMPESLERSRYDEYREYFIEHYKSYGHSEGLRDPRIFMRHLIEKFNLSESKDSRMLTIDEMVSFYFKKEYIPNSEVEEFNMTLDFAKESERIHSLINCFKELTAYVEYNKVRSAHYIQGNKNIGEEERDKYKKILIKRKELVARILNFHFRKLSEQGFDISSKIFELVGFTPCKSCCRYS